MNAKVVGLCTLLFVSPATAQTNDLQALLGKEVPHELKLKELTSEWRRATITTAGQTGGKDNAMQQLMQLGMMDQQGKGKGASEMAGAMAVMSMLGGMFGGGGGDQAPAYYTKWRTLGLGGEQFLVTYKLDVKAPSIMELAMQSQKEGGKEPDLSKVAAASKPTPDSAVSLALINLKSVATITDIRPFELERELVEAGKSGGLMDMFSLFKDEGKGVDTPAPAVSTDTGDQKLSTVREAILADSQLSGRGNRLEVELVNDRIVLKGSVASANLKSRAENVARRALKEAGMTASVSNQIVVKSAK
jgi:hypothetical protein